MVGFCLFDFLQLFTFTLCFLNGSDPHLETRLVFYVFLVGDVGEGRSSRRSDQPAYVVHLIFNSSSERIMKFDTSTKVKFSIGADT